MTLQVWRVVSVGGGAGGWGETEREAKGDCYVCFSF